MLLHLSIHPTQKIAEHTDQLFELNLLAWQLHLRNVILYHPHLYSYTLHEKGFCQMMVRVNTNCVYDSNKPRTILSGTPIGLYELQIRQSIITF